MDFSIETGRAVLARTPIALQAFLSGLPDDWTASNEGAGTWSPYQVVGHLVHLEEVDWMDRVRVIHEQDNPGTFRPIDREAGFARFEGWSLGDLLDRFTSLRVANLADLDELVESSDLG